MNKFTRRSRLIVLAVITFALILLANFANFGTFLNSDRIYVAMLAPMTGPNGEVGKEMVQGTQMYLDKINREGGINGKKVKLRVFDDQGQVSVGQEEARKIAEDQQIVLSLGSYTSSVSLEAGKIYEQAGLAAITATAQANAVTEENKTYFRVGFTTHDEGVLLANYLKKILQEDNVSIIFDGQDSWSNSLTRSFRNTFRGLKGNIRHQWDIQQIAPNSFGSISDFWQLDREELGTVVLFPLGQDAASLLGNMKRAGIDTPVVGGISLTGQSFLSQLRTFPEAQAKPGYFSDQLYATSPLLYDVSSEATQDFRNQFIEKYDYQPTWVGALSYDGAKMAVEALKGANLNVGKIANKRQSVYDSLSNLMGADRGIAGLERPLYFDRDRNTPSNINIGIYEQQNLISAPVQLQPIPEQKTISNLEEQLENGQILRMGGQYAYITQVVYTGIDINQISKLDLKDQTYIVDFFLWFRHPGTMEIEKLEFLNAAEPIKLEEPIYEEEKNHMKVRAFRIKTTFEGDFSFQDYPFDNQELKIEFRHDNLRRNNLIYVPDITGMQNPDLESIKQKFANSEVLDSLESWKFQEVTFFENTDKGYSTLGDLEAVNSADSGINYSKFNVAISIARQSFSFSINDLLPLACFIWILYIFLFFPFDEFSVESVSGLLLGVVFFHVGLKSELPDGIGYIIALDMFFYVIYGLIAAQILLVVAILRFKDHLEWKKKLNRIVKYFRLLFPAYILGAALFIGWFYNILPTPNKVFAEQSTTNPPIEVSTNPEQTPPLKGKTLLTFANWKPEYQKPFQDLFRQFYQDHPEIRLKSIATPYGQYSEVLRNQLQNEVAADLVFLRAYSLDRNLFEKGYLETLNDLPGLKENYTSDSLNPWQTTEGAIYGVPLSAVANGIYYNVDLFQQLNLDIPQTWEDLLNTAQRFQAQGILPFANSPTNNNYERDDRIFTSILPNFTGGQEGRLAYQNGDRCFNDANMIAAFQALADLKPYLDLRDHSLIVSRQTFLNQEAAMWISGSYDLQPMISANPDFAWNIFPFPSPQGQPTSVILHPDFAVGLNANSPHKEEAQQFLQWLMTPEAADIITNRLPGNFVLHQEKPAVRHPKAQIFFDFIQTYDTDVRWTYPQLDEKIPQGYTLAKKASTAVLKGEMTPQEAANFIQQGLAEWYEPAQTCEPSVEANPS
ncbi:extracellular solute-binding protein [Spirulina sp. CS-785/01]|uniref:extracellular solute-binding protein n=1 Tax=Spirulina sp. CS-785/01 TaxID=3021716 RepID=UPI00233004F2|nr:extracellular solute-binding protein [Spirulina sp. CS-785/01]MDB9312749.1 extracellular solute-binding protein [Spirulina sp. CS-785/01]